MNMISPNYIPILFVFVTRNPLVSIPGEFTPRFIALPKISMMGGIIK